jgi:prophage DNA circulation protein
VKIKDLHNPWRDLYDREPNAQFGHAKFRSAEFFVETNSRAGGRRVALHEYPKRNVPYAEDMGRAAIKFAVQGYCIGPYYLTAKDRLVDALEQNGPGTLWLPLMYRMEDIEVMVNSYAVTESRERGGICMVEMQFIEYGDPAYREVAFTPAQIDQSAQNAERAVTGEKTATTDEEVAPYNDTWVSGMPSQ